MQYEERDFLLRWMKQFFQFIDRIINNRMPADELPVIKDIDRAYDILFKSNREFFLNMRDDGLIQYSKMLLRDQIRPLALLLYHDACIQPEIKHKENLFHKAKLLLLFSQETTGVLPLDDYTLLLDIDNFISLAKT